ncbi:MAG: DUF177 domain-containing protein [Tissierellia bacterium]|nr:DUF177 domain-containing protein [Tissierellia bacterium]
MIIDINKFLSSDALSLKINENFVIDDKEFLSRTNLNENIELKGEIFKLRDGISFTGAVIYTFEDECARCLKEFENKIENKFQAAIVPEEDEESDEVQFVIKDRTVIMGEAIKQLIYMSMPMKTLCSKDCKGLCPTCGVNFNYEKCQCENTLTDPRFDKLKDLLKN